MVNKKPSNLKKYWGRKLKDLWSKICQKSPKLQVEYFKEKNWEKLSKKKFKDFFTYLVIVLMNLASGLRFVIEVAMVGLTVCLAISEAVLMETDIAIGFSELFLW